MERRKLYLWLIGISAVGILFIFSLGRPTSDISTVPVAAGYTPAPSASTLSPSSIADLATSAVLGAKKTTAPVAVATVTPVVDARNQEVAAPLPEAPVAESALTMEKSTFNAASVLNTPLRDGIGKIAQNIPGATIRPYPLGTTLPPGPVNPNRWNLQYDPSTLTVTQVTDG